MYGEEKVDHFYSRLFFIKMVNANEEQMEDQNIDNDNYQQMEEANMDNKENVPPA